MSVWLQHATFTAMVIAVLPGCRGSLPGPPAEAPSVIAQVDAVRAGRTAMITATSPLSAAEWESIRGLEGLRVLALEAGRADDRTVAVLASLPESPLTDDGFAALTGVRSLRDLNVPHADCTAAGVRALAMLPNLRALRLGGVRGTPMEICEAVASLAHLRSLHLIDVPIGDAGLGVLARMPGLWNLYLDGGQ
ncbi:MAG: hypothetical protein EBS51_15100 [Planctomycetia bacterium]|nr:hypothetical protein [Planctomycetia bacterium]